MENDKLKKLLEQRKALDAKIQLEQNRENEKKRKETTRQKILVGAAVLDEIGKNEKLKADIDRLLASFLTRDNDRALFGLPPLPVVKGTESKKIEVEQMDDVTTPPKVNAE
jgi:hypothetical protein